MKRSAVQVLSIAIWLVLIASVPQVFSAQANATLATALRAVMQTTPDIEYPIEARTRRITGRGRFDIWFRTKTGEVTRVDVLQSTGSKLLDAAAMNGLSRWRAKPGKVSHMQVPVYFVI